MSAQCCFGKGSDVELEHKRRVRVFVNDEGMITTKACHPTTCMGSGPRYLHGILKDDNADAVCVVVPK